MITMPKKGTKIIDYLKSINISENWFDYYLNTNEGVCPKDAVVVRVSPRPFVGVQFITCLKDGKKYEVRYEC